MTQTLEDSNAALRRAVETRLATGSYDEYVELTDTETRTITCEPTPFYPPEWTDTKPMPECTVAEVSEQAPRGWSAEQVIERFAAPQRTFYGVDSGTTRAEQTLNEAIAAVRDRHGKYGPPQEHFGRTAALVNAAFGTSFTPADWALVMVLDKIARQVGPGRETDDAAVDIAGYAACHQECRKH